MRSRNLIVLVGCLALFSYMLTAQDDLGKQLSKVASQNAVNYLSPVLSAWGADLNSGLYHSADLHDILGFDVGLKVGAVMVKDEDKVFDLVLPDQMAFTYNGTKYTLNAGVDYDKVIPGAPTALGDPNGKAVTIKSTSPLVPLRGQTIFTSPKGFDMKFAALLMPQAAIGLPFGLEVIGRFVPNTTLPDNAGKVNFIGFGIRHSIDQYIPLCPIDISIHFMNQKLTISDMNDHRILGASGIAYGIEVSKSLAFLTVYGGYQIEHSEWDVDLYNPDPSLTQFIGTPLTIDGFHVDGKNTSRLHAGVRLLLAIINVHADYSFATQPVIAAGVGISLR
ncbi:MAG: hypothetical protein NTZ35_15780 [Ignavibacteriales bacterium]|nr:hypothetical protein [Ignavibacteriales bacterium]